MAGTACPADDGPAAMRERSRTVPACRAALSACPGLPRRGVVVGQEVLVAEEQDHGGGVGG